MQVVGNVLAEVDFDRRKLGRVATIPADLNSRTFRCMCCLAEFRLLKFLKEKHGGWPSKAELARLRLESNSERVNTEIAWVLGQC